MAKYQFNYADGTSGDSSIQRDASGQIIYNANGSINEGAYGGWVGTDGKVTQGTPGGVAMSVMGHGDQYLPSTWTPTDGTFVDPATVQPAARPGGATFGGGGGGGSTRDNSYGGGTSGASSAGQNPYLKQMGDVMVGQMTDNFNRKVMPGISSQMMASGGYGGSRQGVMEANGVNDLNGQIGGALTNLYGQGFNTALNYDLGLRGNDLGFAGLDAQINQNNFNNNLAGANFGMGVWNQGMANNQTGINAGTNVQNTPMNYWSQFGNQYNSIGQGFGSTTGTTSQQGNPVMGALGGAQLGSRLGNMWGGGVGGSAGSTQDWTYGGSGSNRGPSGNIDWIYG